MSLNKRIETNIKKVHFLYFLCTIGMIGVFMYIAWKNDLFFFLVRAPRTFVEED